MKKIIAILSTAAIILAVSSCASTKTETAGTTASDSSSVPCINNPAPTGDVLLLDSFEEGNYWQAVGDTWDQWGAHNLSLTADTTDKWASDGTNSGEWVFDVAGPDSSKQACFFCDALVEVDWSQYKYLVCDVDNVNNEPIELGVAAQTTDSWTWSQTDAQKLGVGVNKNVTFDISSFAGRELVKRGILQVLGENKGGTIYVDNIRLAK